MIVSVALYKPLGIAGLVIGTAAANIVMTALQLRRLRIGLNGRLEGGQTLMITVRIIVATILMAALARGVWVALDRPARSLAGRADLRGRDRDERRGGAVYAQSCCGCACPRPGRSSS